MSCVEWSDELSIGIPAVDEEHQKLVEIVNELCEASQARRGTRVMNRILTELMEYTEFHFKSEEKQMEDAGYPDFELHQAQHRQLVQKLEKFRVKFQVSHQRITKEMLEFLQYWLTKHILVDDMAFGRYMDQVTSGEPLQSTTD